MQNIALEENEKIIFELRSLYGSYGYAHYKMSKFEEYNLYSKNIDFLVSDGVITFTDTNGKLMALKPDVTLSIIKNTEKAESRVQKLYYDENVYRVAKSTHSFRELMQVGLECIGEVDRYCIYEVLSLALESLLRISVNSILDISSIDILLQVIEYIGIPESRRNEILRIIGQKNLPEITRICAELGITETDTELLKTLILIHGTPETVFNKTDSLLENRVDAAVYTDFKETVMSLSNKQYVNIDFSVTDDINYYNGIVFKGFVEGVPNSVLSGGQYDSLLKKMGRSQKAIGFAVYTDMLDMLYDTSEKYDTDILLVYGKNIKIAEVTAKAEVLRKSGERVLVLSEVPENVRYRKLVTLGEVKNNG